MSSYLERSRPQHQRPGSVPRVVTAGRASAPANPARTHGEGPLPGDSGARAGPFWNGPRRAPRPFGHARTREKTGSRNQDAGLRQTPSPAGRAARNERVPAVGPGPRRFCAGSSSGRRRSPGGLVRLAREKVGLRRGPAGGALCRSALLAARGPAAEAGAGALPHGPPRAPSPASLPGPGPPPAPTAPRHTGSTQGPLRPHRPPTGGRGDCGSRPAPSC